jgi:hypothetical protein
MGSRLPAVSCGDREGSEIDPGGEGEGSEIDPTKERDLEDQDLVQRSSHLRALKREALLISRDSRVPSVQWVRPSEVVKA